MRTLVLGGARSGKSIHAEALVMPATTVDYVATSAVDPEDAEWVERIALHQGHGDDRRVEGHGVAVNGLDGDMAIVHGAARCRAQEAFTDPHVIGCAVTSCTLS